jgi:spore coat polysaccharide biosynthesis protein SpsF (cytidylyltransferase family)/aryl-alcohol dehydrogenase-like predicted oxidoreductase
MATRRIAILQARTTSSRLPAKVMLPIEGRPMVVLAAQRAGNTGVPVLVATSHDATDDGLARLLAQYGVAHMRGDLHDTLARYAMALQGCEDDTIVFRLTADNVVPDGHLLDELTSAFVHRGVDYLGCGGEGSGLPYGVSAEVVRAGWLRRAAKEATSPHDREHVTPFIRNATGDARYTAHAGLALESLRCTVDTLDDYLLLQKLFANRGDCDVEHYLSTVERLRHLPVKSPPPHSAARLTLGTAQLGLPYGIANRAGQPSEQAAQEVILTAIASGIRSIDTARAYGSSERAVGKALQQGGRSTVTLVTKLAPLADIADDAAAGHVVQAVRASVFQSLAELRTTPDVLMLHRASHLSAWRGTVPAELLRLRQDGYLCELGASVQSPEELHVVLANPEIKHIQVPFNVLDWRWDDGVALVAEARRKRPLVIYARSVLLQGLLTSTTTAHWHRAHVVNHESVIAALAAMAEQVGSPTITDMALRYVLSQSWIDQVVIGVETKEQLESALASAARPSFADDQCATLQATRPRLDERSLDPVRWSTK